MSPTHKARWCRTWSSPKRTTRTTPSGLFRFATASGSTTAEPLTGEAVAYNLNLCKIGQLTGTAFLGIDEITGEGQTVIVTAAQPLAAGIGPYVRAESCGFMFSPAWLETLPNNPQYSSPFSPLSPQERAEGMARATGDPAAPVGLGAFRFVSYTPGNGNSFLAERNPDYWRGPNGITGESLPYLDEIEFVVTVDILGRSNGLKAGQFDIIHTSNEDEIAKYESNASFVLLQANDYGETGYNMVNVAAGVNPVLAAVRGAGEPVPMDPLGINADNPLVHLSCRKALAHAFDGERFVDERLAGIGRVANGPFAPGSMGYLEDTGYPEVRPRGCRRLVRPVQGRQRAESGPILAQYAQRPGRGGIGGVHHCHVAGGIRRRTVSAHPADRAGPVHRAHAGRALPADGNAQPRRRRPV